MKGLQNERFEADHSETCCSLYTTAPHSRWRCLPFSAGSCALVFKGLLYTLASEQAGCLSASRVHGACGCHFKHTGFPLRCSRWLVI